MLLSVLGILISIILGIIMAVLFVPVRYSLDLDKSKNVQAQITISWFLKTFKLEYTWKGFLRIMLFGIDISKIKKKKKKKKKKKQKQKSKQESTVSLEKEPIENVEEESIEKKPLEKESIEQADVKVDIQEDATIVTSSDEPISLDAEKNIDCEVDKKSESIGIFARIKDILNKVSGMAKHPDKDEIIRLSKLFAKRSFKALKPTRLWVRGEIGLEDPAATGYLFAGIGVLCGMTGIDIKVKGNFEKNVQNVQVQVKGRLYLGVILWVCASYFLAKPIWKIVKKIIFEKDDSNE